MVNIVIGIILSFLSPLMFYLYATNFDIKNKSIKTFFTFRLYKKTGILACLAVIVSLIIFFYDYFYKTETVTLIQSYLNVVMFSLLLSMAYVDYKKKIIPNTLICVGLIIWLVVFILELFVAKSDLSRILLFSALGGGICPGILLVISLIAKSALGMGDVKMFFVIGLLYGFTNTYSILLFTMLFMAIFSIVMLAAKKVTRKTAIPMAPFTVLGFLMGIVFGM